MAVSRLKVKVRIGEGLLLILMVALAGLPFFQTRVTKGLQIDFESRQGAVKEIESNLQTIALSLLQYLDGHTTGSLKRIEIAGKEVSHLLRVYKEGAGPQADQDPENLEHRYEALRAATLAVLDADAAEKENQAALARASDALLGIFSDKIRPSLRPNQLSAYARLQVVLDAESEARALAHNAADARRFHAALQQYENFARTRTARASIDEMQRLFLQGQQAAAAMEAAAQRKQDQLQVFSDAYRDLDRALEAAARIDGPLPESGLRAWIFGIPKSVIGLLAGMFLVALVGVFGIDRLAVTRVVEPMRSLVQAAEAAAVGDLSRAPDLFSKDEIGRLSAAVHRLIHVLGRSENMVYHLAALVEASGDAIISQNLDGTILSWNKGAQRIYGYSAEEAKGHPILLLTPGSSELIEVIARIKRGERIAPFDMRQIAKNGRVIKAFVRAAAVLDSTRQVIGVSFCAQEIPDAPASGLNVPESAALRKP